MIMARIDDGLGAGKSQPHQRIEQVMPVMRARRYFTLEIAARFVLRFERQFAAFLFDEAQRQAALQGDGCRVCGQQRIAILQGWKIVPIQFGEYRMEGGEQR